MKSDIEIQMRKIRKQLQKHTITEDEKAELRAELKRLKELHKKQKNS